MTKPSRSRFLSGSGLAATCAVLALGSCQREPLTALQPFAAPLTGLVELTGDLRGTPQSPLAFWERDGLTLSATDTKSLLALWRLNQTLDLVMVTIPKGSALAAELAADPRILALLPSPTEATVFALMPGNDSFMLNGIAAAAHAAGGHACGRVERLSLHPGAQLTTTTAATPPLYNENVHLEAVAALVARPEASRIGNTIVALENMGTRFHEAPSGLQAPTTIKAFFDAAAQGQIAGMTVELVAHAGTKQKSVVVRIPGTEDPDTTVVIGSHLDSINSDDKSASGDAPGADDNASGVATLVEMVRALAQSQAKFRRSVELHAYAAEEVGLIGSKEISQGYRADGRKVAAMMQFDMNTWSADGKSTIYLVINDTSATLRRSAKDLLHNYLGGDFVEQRLSGGTSDHRAWAEAGYLTVFPFENPQAYNEALHTPADTSTTINTLPMAERFAGLGLAFIAHHAGLAAAAGAYESTRSALVTSYATDLKLAIVPSLEGDAGTYDVGVAVPSSVQRVELCLTGAAGSDGCIKTRVQTAADRSANDRTFFASDTAVALAAGDHLALFGYDADDKLLMRRTVGLKAK